MIYFLHTLFDWLSGYLPLPELPLWQGLFQILLILLHDGIRNAILIQLSDVLYGPGSRDLYLFKQFLAAICKGASLAPYVLNAVSHRRLLCYAMVNRRLSLALQYWL